MLHSTLPRAFLAPGLKYLSGYYGEDSATFPVSSYPTPFDEHYPRAGEHHVFPTWRSVQRPASPCPLDLSLKPSKPELNLREELNVVDSDEEEPKMQDGHREQTLLFVKGDELGETRSFHGDDVQISSPEYHLSGPKLLLHSPGYHPQSLQAYQHHHQLLMTPQHHLQDIHAPMTPPSTPSPPQCPRKRPREENQTTSLPPNGSRQSSPGEKTPRPKKKHARRLKFDEDTSSPVSGTVILGPDEAVVTGDIDPAFNVVEVTEEARAELAKIENRLGPYQCRLCRQLHEDAFQLAQHRCSRIAHVEYRCPECDKRFSCPANLASHRRWHKPRVPPGDGLPPTNPTGGNGAQTSTTATEFPCTRCDAKFSRQATLRKHVTSQHPEINGTGICSSSNGRTSTGSTASGSSLVGNPEQILGHVGAHLGVSPLTVEMP